MDRIQELIEELTAKNPDLKGQEAELRQLLIQVQSAKPDVVLDPEFKNRLKQELVQKIEADETKANQTSQKSPRSWLYSLSWGLSGAVAGVVLVFVLQTQTNLWDQANDHPESNDDLASQESAVEEDVSSETKLQINLNDFSQSFFQISGMGSGGGYGVASDSSSPQIQYSDYEYQFSYEGDEDWMSPEEEFTVYQVDSSKNQIEFEQLLDLFEMDSLLDSGQVGDIEAESLRFTQKDGYEIHFNLAGQSITMSYDVLGNHAGGDNLRLEDWPEKYTNEDLVQFAKDELAYLGISIPESDSTTVTMLSKPNDPNPSYEIIFPIQVNDEDIYIYPDIQKGLVVQIQVYDEPFVTYIKGLEKSALEPQKLDAIEKTDFTYYLEEAYKVAYGYPKEDAEPVSIELGTPELHFYELSSSFEGDYYVPMYEFPILNDPDGIFSEVYLVPAVKDFVILPKFLPSLRKGLSWEESKNSEQNLTYIFTEN